MASYRTDAITLNTTAGNKTVAITPAVGELIVAIAANSGTTTDPTVTDDRGGTYTRIPAATVIKNASADEMHFYVRDQPCQVALSHTLTMNVGGAGTGGGIWAACIPGMGKSGANAVRQAAVQSNQAGGGTPTATFTRDVLTESLVIFAVFNGATTAAVTEPSGFTERRDTGYNTPPNGLEVATRDAGQTGLTVTAQSTSATAFGMLAVELDVATPTFAGSGRTQTPGRPHGPRLYRPSRRTTGEEAVGYSMSADPGTYAVTGVAASVVAGRALTAVPGSYALTGQAATLVRGYAMTAVPGAYAVTGAAATLLAARALTAVPGSYAVTGVAATLAAGRSLTAVPGVYVVTGANATFTVLVAYSLSADPGVYAVTGQPATLAAGRALTAVPGVYAVNGAAASLVSGRMLSANPGSYLVNGFPADLATVGAFALLAEPGVYAVNGAAASLVAGRVIVASPGAYSITGIAAALLRGRTLTASPGAYAINGAPADLALIGVYALLADPGAYAINGAAATLAAGRVIATDTGVYVIVGEDASPIADQFLSAVPGAYLVTGAAADLLLTVITTPAIVVGGTEPLASVDGGTVPVVTVNGSTRPVAVVEES